VVNVALPDIRSELGGSFTDMQWVVDAYALSLAALVLTADLFRAHMGFNPAIPIEHAEQPTTGAIRYLQSRRPNRFVGLDLGGYTQPLPPNLGMRYGLYDARGYDFPVDRHFDRFWRGRIGLMYLPSAYIAEPTARAVRALGLLSVSDLMQDPAASPVRMPGLRLAYSGPDARIYRNTKALPRTFLVDRQQTVEDSEAALRATTDPRFDARRVAVTERPVPGLSQEPRRSRGAPGAARLVAYERERVVAEATARRRSLLVLTDIHYPGWKARVDGRPAALERVDYLLRGVPLAPGTHRIEFRYEPLSWRIGWIISALALAVLGALTIVGLRDRRRARAATPGAPSPGSR
jgi:hypothetical protein